MVMLQCRAPSSSNKPTHAKLLRLGGSNGEVLNSMAPAVEPHTPSQPPCQDWLSFRWDASYQV